MECLKAREVGLREELRRARAENAAMSTELRQARDVYKEAAAARKTAREALSELAQQNARLVTAFVEKRQELRSLQVRRCEREGGRFHTGWVLLRFQKALIVVSNHTSKKRCQ